MAKLASTPNNYTDAMKALKGRDSRRIGNNTNLETRSDHIAVTLHGNSIVRYYPDRVEASWAGYGTSTTRDRLNQLTEGRFNISKFEPHYNGQPVDAYAWVTVEPFNWNN